MSIYYIRHGRADFPPGEHLCLGSTDLPLGPLGRMQAALLAEDLRQKGVTFSTVYSSPLKRALETASFLECTVEIVPDFAEFDAGEWDGLSFDEIKERWPELYAERANDFTLPMPGGEAPVAAGRRFTAAFEELHLSSDANVAIVAHNIVLTEHLGMHGGRIPNAGYVLDGETVTPYPAMSPELAAKLLDASGVPDSVKAHCAVVADVAVRLSEDLGLDENLIKSAALLHDVARTETNHPELGARYLEELGYSDVAGIIRSHHDCSEKEINETSVVYLADKYVRGTDIVTLKDRFATSAAKCSTSEAVRVHEERFKAALELEKRLIACKIEATKETYNA